MFSRPYCSSPPRGTRPTLPIHTFPLSPPLAVILIGANLLGTGFSYWGGGVYCGQNVSTTHPSCSDNGETNLPFGNWRYVGLGFVVFFTLVIVEIFGSPFMRNIQVRPRGPCGCCTDCLVLR